MKNATGLHKSNIKLIATLLILSVLISDPLGFLELSGLLHASLYIVGIPVIVYTLKYLGNFLKLTSLHNVILHSVIVLLVIAPCFFVKAYNEWNASSHYECIGNLKHGECYETGRELEGGDREMAAFWALLGICAVWYACSDWRERRNRFDEGD